MFLSIVIALPPLILYYWWLSFAIGGLAVFLIGVLLEAFCGFSLTIWQNMITFALVTLASFAVQCLRYKRQKDSEAANKGQNRT